MAAFKRAALGAQQHGDAGCVYELETAEVEYETAWISGLGARKLTFDERRGSEVQFTVGRKGPSARFAEPVKPGETLCVRI